MRPPKRRPSGGGGGPEPLPPGSNHPPEFSKGSPTGRTVAENSPAGTSIGAPVTVEVRDGKNPEGEPDRRRDDSIRVTINLLVRSVSPERCPYRWSPTASRSVRGEESGGAGCATTGRPEGRAGVGRRRSGPAPAGRRTFPPLLPAAFTFVVIRRNRTKPPAARGIRIDWLGTLLAVGLSAFLLVATWGGREHAWNSAVILSTLAGGRGGAGVVCEAGKEGGLAHPAAVPVPEPGVLGREHDQFHHRIRSLPSLRFLTGLPARFLSV